MKNTIFKQSRVVISVSLVLATSFGGSSIVYAADEAVDDDSEVIQVIGSRSHKMRTVSDSPVPVDILSASELNAMGGNVDLTDNLKTLIPSYTATPGTGDGTAFVRSTSLRGTSSDQTLVLVDGKRRHRSSVLQFFAPAAGNGAQGSDIGLIPAIAMKRVEVLRDGAASQYGSDAIAGVINFVTKDASEGGEVIVKYGQYYEGEQTYTLGINKGFNLNDKGFVNISLETQDNEALSRGIQRPDAQAIIDSGVIGVGADSPSGDAPLVQSWGRPESSATRFFLNSGYQVGENAELYARLGYAKATGRYRFFYRNPNDDDDGAALIALIGLGYTGPLAQTGYTPYLDGDQKDISFVSGLKGEYENGTYYDFSFGYGKNELDLFLTREINPGLGLTAELQIPQMNFDTGGYIQEETGFNADFSKPVSDSINVAYGFELRKETFTQLAGERNSWVDLSTGAIGTGVDGRISPSDAGSASRQNSAVYLDIEQDVNLDFLMQYAVRYEKFDDFGSTFNGKVASRYNLTDETTLRGAISTGFRAPTPAQASIRTTISTISETTGLLTIEGLVPSTDPAVASVGGKQLTEEKSLNISFGVSSDLTDNTTLSVDFYQIQVDDRIYRTGDIVTPEDVNISFYTNAIDVEHNGVDVVLTSNLDWTNDVSTDISFAYSYNKIDVVNQRLVNGIQPVSDAIVEDIENNFPNNRFVLTGNTAFNEDWNLMVRANFYGEHYDERGTINDPDQPTALIGSVTYIDLELSYQLTDQMMLRFGGANIFNSFIDKVGPPNANTLNVGMPYPRRSAANYEGGSWYFNATYNF